MKGIMKNFALVFFVGFAAMAVALGYGSIAGEILIQNAAIVALRAFGAGAMITGMAMWIVLLRDEAGKPGLNPLLAFLLLVSMLLLLTNLFIPGNSYAFLLTWIGIGLAATALLLGLLSMLISPAYPQPPTARWPEESKQGTSHHGPNVH